MSMARCDGCEFLIDTDEDSDACIYAEDYPEIEQDCFLCINCRERLWEKSKC